MRFLHLAILCALLVSAALRPVQALTLLRDPDIEHALHELAAPIFNAAGVNPAQIDILLIDDRSLNAFVIDQHHIFIHSGLLLKMKTPAMLQSVIAHETAHITNGHLVRRPVLGRNANKAAAIGAALAAAAAITAGSIETAPLAAAGAYSGAQRRFLVHTRAEENAADQTGAQYLAAAGIDVDGAVEVMEIFRGQEALSAARQDPYARTHPLSADRYRVLKRLADEYADKTRPQPLADYWFARAKAKLSAFQHPPKWTLARAGDSEFQDVNLMRQAVAWHRRSDLSKALETIEKALALRPDDPFLYELKGQILMENRRISDAVLAYGRATELAPNNALILGAYGHAVLVSGRAEDAQKILEKARARDGRDVRVLRDLAAAHAQMGEPGMAAVLTAERYALYGRLQDAAVHARRASDLLPRGSAAWRRAQDVLSAAIVEERRGKKRRR